MRRNLLIPILLAGLFYKTAAQPVLNDAEKYTAGKVYDYYMADTTGLKPGAGGSNVSWNFSTLQTKPGNFQRQGMLPSQTGYEADFPNATIATKDNTDTYLFYNDKNDTLWMEGLRVDASNITIKYSKPQVYLIRPLAFGNTFSGTALYSYSYTTFDYKGGGNYQFTVDGHGSLTLPTGTFNNVIRTKFEQNFFDTLQGGGNFVQTVRTTSYSWYNAYNNAALLTIDSTFISSPQFTTVRKNAFYLKSASNSIAGVEKGGISVSVYNSSLVFSGLATEIYSASVYDMAGRQIASGHVVADSNTGVMQLPETLPAGCYIIQLSGGNNNLQLKMVIL